MAKTDLSEFSFGFAYTFELTTLWEDKLIKSPYLPSLVEEGKLGGGYDVALDTRLNNDGFLYCAQFKLSEFRQASHAREAKAGYTHRPYYRFPIRGNQPDDQHEMLLALEDPDTLVEYVAPMFTDRNSLDHHFRMGDLRSQVIRVIPSVIRKLPDDKEHRVVCDQWGKHRERFSESVKLESSSDWGEITEEGFARRPIRAKPVIPQEAARQGNSETQSPKKVREQLIDFTHKVIFVLEESTEKTLLRASRSEDGVPNLRFYLRDLDRDPVGTAQKVSRILLGAELFVFSDEPQSRETPRSLSLDSGS